MHTFCKVMKERIQNWEWIISRDPMGESYDIDGVKNCLEEDKNIVREMANSLEHLRNFDRVDFFKKCGLI